MPPDRYYDVTREVDLIEEVARVHGIDEHLPTTLPAVAGRVGGLSREQRLRRRAEDGLRDLGFDQVVGWSFTDPGEPARLRLAAEDPRADPVLLSNPLSEDQSAMRTMVLGSLLDVASRNVARGADRLALFEAGSRLPRPPVDGPKYARYEGNRPIDPLAGEFPGERPAPVTEPHRYAALARRAARRALLAGRRRAGRLLRAQGSAGGARGPARAPSSSFAPAAEPFLHPGRSAAVSRRRAAGGLARRAAPARLPRLGPRCRGRLRNRRGAAARPPPAPARRPTRT